MQDLPREITARNIDRLFSRFVSEAELVGESIAGLRGVRLLSALKRDVVGAGPYPNVTLFEAANRIMTDLVMLHGVRWLLKHEVFPFHSYTVEYGHGNEGAHDIVAREGGKILIGEVFNVAPSFFPLKKATALKKLRASKTKAEYRLILVNHDAVPASYVPKPATHEYLVFVNVGTGEGRVVPGRKGRGA
jgi:hypothetical protein